jgi:hypothetical protein
MPIENLPADLRVVAWSHAHVVFERLDQIEARQPAVLVELPKGQVWPMPLSETDGAHAKDLVGETVRLELRRSAEVGAREPIAYVRKAAASPAIRAKIIQRNLQSKKQEKRHE